MPEALSPHEVRAALATRWLGHPLVVLDRVDSTNRAAMEDTGLGHGAVLAARRQTAGKGRMGRTWQVPDGTVPFSLVLAPQISPDRMQLLTLATAVGLTDGIREHLHLSVDIKWPNDLLVDGKKLAGILTEARSDPDRIMRAVVGIGLNVNTDAGAMTGELAGRTTSLKTMLGRRVPVSPLLANILSALEAVYDELAGASGPEQILERYRERCVTLGREVTVRERNGSVRTCRANGVDGHGALLVITPEGKQERLFSADVSLSARDALAEGAG